MAQSREGGREGTSGEGGTAIDWARHMWWGNGAEGWGCTAER